MKSHFPAPKDADVTRQAILMASLSLFVEEGFDNVGVRAIGSRAGVDPSLINRYFGGKDELFVEVIQLGKNDWLRLRGPTEDFPQRAAKALLCGSDASTVFRGMIIMMRSSGSEKARKLIEESFGSSFFADLEQWIGGAEADVRARLLMGLLAGMAFARNLNCDFELHSERTDALVDHLASAIRYFLSDMT